MSSPQHRERGFTLLELLVAITLLGVLIAALFGALRLGARVWETGEARLDANGRVQVAQEFLRRQLSQAMPLLEVTGDPAASGRLLFEGDQDRLRFVSLLPEHLGAGANLMELAVRDPAHVGAPGDLVIRWQQLELSSEAGPARESEEQILIEGIESLEITYFSGAPAEAKPTWWQEWRQQRSLPSLVRVRVGFPDGDGRSWPELMVALMVHLAPPS